MMPREIRDCRRTLRYRHLLARQMVQMKNLVSGRLMETGVEYSSLGDRCPSNRHAEIGISPVSSA
jgi:hypothetical protein